MNNPGDSGKTLAKFCNPLARLPCDTESRFQLDLRSIQLTFSIVNRRNLTAICILGPETSYLFDPTQICDDLNCTGSERDRRAGIFVDIVRHPPQNKLYDQNDCKDENRNHVSTETEAHSNAGRCPQRGCGIYPLHAVSVSEDHSTADESYAGYNTSSNLRQQDALA